MKILKYLGTPFDGELSLRYIFLMATENGGEISDQFVFYSNIWRPNTL